MDKSLFFSRNQLQTCRDGDCGHAPTHNSFEENKTSRNKASQRSEEVLQWKANLWKRNDNDTRIWKKYPMLVGW